MKITLNHPVHSADGPFGALCDVVVDPRTNSVTHLVVEPHHRHYQARLVPMSLVEVDGGTLTVQLDEQHLRSLQRVAEHEFVRVSEPIDLGELWDVGIEHIVTVPMSEYEFDMLLAGDPGMGIGGDDLSIDFDRIPKGECEIRHDSQVISTDSHLLGLVAGMIVDDGHIEGVMVQTGFVGFRHIVAVPIGAVAKVRNDAITLTMDKATFRGLTPMDESSDGSSGGLPKLAAVEHRLAGLVKRWGAKLHHK